MATDLNPIVTQSEVQKVCIYVLNADGTLSPVLSPGVGGPIVQSSEVIKIWLFAFNADGTLSPAVVP